MRSLSLTILLITFLLTIVLFKKDDLVEAGGSKSSNSRYSRSGSSSYSRRRANSSRRRSGGDADVVVTYKLNKKEILAIVLGAATFLLFCFMCYKHRQEDWKNRRARKVHTTPTNEYIPAKTSSQVSCANPAAESVGRSNNSALKVEPSETIRDPASRHKDKFPAIHGEKAQTSHPTEYAAVLPSVSTGTVGYVPSCQANVSLPLQNPDPSTIPSPDPTVLPPVKSVNDPEMQLSAPDDPLPPSYNDIFRA